MRPKGRTKAFPVALSLLTLFVVSTLCENKLDPDSINNFEKETVKLLQKHAKKLNMEKFYSDPLLIQTVSDKKLKYTYAPTNKVVLENGKTDDFGKEIIIVDSEENEFAIPTPRDGKKRQFILLRKATIQKASGTNYQYHVSFIFLRNLQLNETYAETLTIAGIKSVPEYDIWEHRPTKFYPGWNNCEFSALFTCTSLRALSADAKKQGKGRSRRDLGVRSKREGDNKLLPPPDLIPFQLVDGHDAGELKDLYYDYDYHRFNIELDEDEQEELEKIDKAQLEIASKPEPEAPETVIADIKQEQVTEDERELQEDLVRLEEDRKTHEKNEYKNGTDYDDMIIDIEQDDYSVNFEESEMLLPDRLLRRRKRQLAEDEEIGQKNEERMEAILAAANESDTCAHLFETPTGLTELPGLKSILLVGESEKALKGLLESVVVTDGILVLKTGPKTPGNVVKKGVLIPDLQNGGYKWVGGKPRGSTFGDAEDKDIILVRGNKREMAWDVVNFDLIDMVAPHLYIAGLFMHEARLVALGGMITENAPLLITEVHGVKWRLGTDTVGAALNAGPYRRKGFRENGFPSNVNMTFGIFFPGAGISGQLFFFPWASLTRATFKVGESSMGGFFMPNLPGGADGFYPDLPEMAKNLFDQRGRLIPEGFKGETEDLGITGYLRKGLIFKTDVQKLKGLYDPYAPEWHTPGEEVWVPKSKDKCPDKPEKTRDGKKILYGHILPGMVESPHIFIADGDTISGFFIPNDENFQDYFDAAHGVLTPAQLGGYAVFHSDSLTEVEFMKEVRGVFIPDAMNYAGGVSGVLSRSESCPQKFFFHLDRPSVEFMYIEGYPDTKDVWSPYLKPGQWKWVMPDLEDNATALAKSKKSDDDDDDDDFDKDYAISAYGTKITARKTELFIPIDYKISGTLILVPLNISKKMKAFDADIIGNRYDLPMECTVYLNKTASKEPVSESLMKMFNRSTGIFIPHKFPKGDAIVGRYSIGQLKVSQKIKSHFWYPDQEIWTPVGFIEKMIAQSGADSDDDNEEAEKAELEAKEKFAAEAYQLRRGMPGVLTRPRPQSKKISNYKFGSLYDPESDEMKDTYGELNLMPHYYTFGYFIKYKSSSHPVFIPEIGAIGTFTPENATFPSETVFFFPPRDGYNATFLLERDGNGYSKIVRGRFQPTSRRPCVGFIPVKLDTGGHIHPIGPADVIPGWKQVDMPKVTHDMLRKGWERHVKPGQLKSSKKPLKYILVELGGGFKGIVVQGVESVDDPNNPIFQQYLHYKAMRDGDVNPFGIVNIVDPIIREELPEDQRVVSKEEEGIFGGLTNLGRGTFVEEMHNPDSMANEIMRHFSVRHWEYKKIGEVLSESGVKREALRLGKQDNVVNMMDFRMYLFRKFTLKRAKYNGAWARMYVPIGAETFVTISKKASPSKKWIENMANSGTPCSLLCKSTTLNFAIHFELDPDEIMKFERPSGEDVPEFDDINDAMSENDKLVQLLKWGDDTVSDEVFLDPFQVAQMSVSIQKGSGASGMDIGFLLTTHVGYETKFSKILQMFLTVVEEESKEKVKQLSLPPRGPQMTDLLGGVKDEVQRRVEDMNEDGSEEETKRTPGGIQGRTFTIDENFKTQRKHHAQVLNGWKTQWRELKENCTLSEAGVIYYGFGNCRQEDVPDIALWKSGRPRKMIKYFLKVLRIDCMENAMQRLINLINEGYLELDKDAKYFKVPFGQKATRALRVTPTELKKLSVAFEFHAFTRTYYNIRQKNYLKQPYSEQPHCNISRSIGFLTEMTLYVITRAPRMAPAHGIRLIRNLLATLRTVMTKLYQDGIILEECDDCAFDILLNKGDQFRVTCLIEFIIHGLAPYESGSLMLRAAFRTFVSMNIDALRQRTLEFGRQFPRTPAVTHVPL